MDVFYYFLRYYVLNISTIGKNDYEIKLRGRLNFGFAYQNILFDL